MKHEAKHGKLKEITIRRMQNGVTIRHEHEPPKHGPKSGQSVSSMDDYDTRRPEFAFNDHAAAVAHINQHLPRMLGDEVATEPDAGDDAGEMTPKSAPTRGRFHHG